MPVVVVVEAQLGVLLLMEEAPEGAPLQAPVHQEPLILVVVVVVAGT